MTERKRKKRTKRLGKRTFSGNTKNRRGAGTRGGRGRAGGHKHKFTKMQHEFGGQKAMKPKQKQKSINLSWLEQKIVQLKEKKLVTEKKGVLVIDGKKIGISKILGKGSISFKAVFKNIAFSKKAKEKLGIAKKEA